jgi:hypothetical protein
MLTQSVLWELVKGGKAKPKGGEQFTWSELSAILKNWLRKEEGAYDDRKPQISRVVHEQSQRAA